LRFVEEGGRTNLQRWSQATEKTACRAGFVLSNDIATALKVLAEEEGPDGELAGSGGLRGQRAVLQATPSASASPSTKIS